MDALARWKSKRLLAVVSFPWKRSVRLEKPLLAGLSGLGMYRGHQGLPRQFYKEQCKEGEEGADKKSVGNNAAREAENKIKWSERVAMYVAPQRSLTTGEHTHALDSLIQHV